MPHSNHRQDAKDYMTLINKLNQTHNDLFYLLLNGGIKICPAWEKDAPSSYILCHKPR